MVAWLLGEPTVDGVQGRNCRVPPLAVRLEAVPDEALVAGEGGDGGGLAH